MGVARQVGEHGFGPAERTLGVDHPFDLAQWCQIRREGSGVGQWSVIAEESETAGLVRCEELLQEQPAKQAREHAHRQEEAR